MKFAKATRTRQPLWIALSGPSGCGKTYSALALATGIQRVFSGPIRGIDTERGRMSHYATDFAFDRADLPAPVSSMALYHAIRDAQTGVDHEDGERYGPPAGCIIVDSASHEHRGYRDFAASEQERLKRVWRTDSDEKVKWPSYNEPRQARALMLDSIQELGATNIIWCFRSKWGTAKEKGKVIQLGWVPIGNKDFGYEMTVRAILPADSDGRPDWKPIHPGQRAAVKIPGFARGIDMQQLTPDVGEQLALWARGDDWTPPVRGVAGDEFAALLAMPPTDDRIAHARGLWHRMDDEQQAAWMATLNASADDDRPQEGTE